MNEFKPNSLISTLSFLCRSHPTPMLNCETGKSLYKKGFLTSHPILISNPSYNGLRNNSNNLVTPTVTTINKKFLSYKIPIIKNTQISRNTQGGATKRFSKELTDPISLHPNLDIINNETQDSTAILKSKWKMDNTNYDLEILSHSLGKFERFHPATLKHSLPEGFAGEMEADIALLPSPHHKLGIMFRKASFEIIAELMSLQNNIDPITKQFSITSNGFLLDGHRGVGKSFILNHVAKWARDNGWLVIFEPRASRFSREVSEIKRSKVGLFIQSEQTHQFLERAMAYNENLLRNIPIKHKTFGNCSLDGSHRLYSQRVMKPLILEAIQKQLEEEELKDGLQFNKRKLDLWDDLIHSFSFPSLSDRVQPETLGDLVDYALNHPAFSVQACYELFEQLKIQTTYPLLILVDEWNECFPVSKYLSILYENTKYDGWIPSYHLTMPRLFHKWDGESFARGIKIYATCWKHIKRRKYRPELLGIRTDEIRTIRNFTPSEFQNYVAYMINSNILYNFPSERLDYAYMLTGGNGFESRRLLTTLY